MIKNYFKTAWRNLFLNKFYSVINITGLVVGLTVGILVLLWVTDELSFDAFNHNAGQIYKVNSSMGTGSTRQVWPGAQAPLAAYALKEIPGIVNAVRIATRGDNEYFKYHNKVFKAGNMCFTDASLFTMFDFKILNGNIKNPFPNDQSVLITQSTAKLYFGDKNPIGEVLTANNNDVFTVTGVVADFPKNSTIQYDMLFPSTSIKSWKSYLAEDWTHYIFKTYLQLQPGVSLRSIEKKLIQIHLKHQPLVNSTDGAYQLQPLAKVHLFAPDGSSTAMQTVEIFVIVAVVILLIASINYVNLSTARAILRLKEVSVRKIVGAARMQLFLQFIIETFLFFLIALSLAILLIYSLMPVYNNIAGKQIYFDLQNMAIWKALGLTLLITFIASSIYPALLLSDFKPINALKGEISKNISGNSFRKILVIIQFVFSTGLIISTLVINKQLGYIRQKQLGYDKSYVFSLPMLDMQNHYQAIKNELEAQSCISGVTSTDQNIINNDFSASDTHWDGKEPNSTFVIHVMEIDKDFLNVFKIKFAGKNFTGAKADTAHYILNETAVKEAGITDPIGKKFALNHANGTIIGIVKDFHFASLKEKIEPLIFTYNPSGRQLFLKTSGRNAPAAIKAVQKVWKQYNSTHLFNYSFLDEDYDSLYKSDEHTGLLFNAFATVAILIACLGLFGLATYTAQAKVKEIGIRKVMGASVVNITTMLSLGFLKLVVISVTIAIPVSWFLMQKWLQEFAYRATVPWWIFAIAGFASVLIAFITMSFQSIKAAIANPVNSLRRE